MSATAAAAPQRSYGDALRAMEAVIRCGRVRASIATPLVETTRSWADALQLPVNQLQYVHIAGSKGKGSTAAFAESILRAHGLRTGLFTSPHLVDIRERIRINGRLLSKTTFAEAFWRVYSGLGFRCEESDGERSGPVPSFFGIMTLMAFDVFLREQVDVVVLEVGIGGRLDATNIIEQPAVTCITSLGMEHTKILGDTLGKIAFEKAGIMKRRVPALSCPQEPEAEAVLRQQAEQRGALLEFVPPLPRSTQLGLEGDHQFLNAALAVRASKIFLASRRCRAIDDALVARALVETKWPGRCQTVADGRLTIFLDGAHTPESVLVCRDWFVQKAAQQQQQQQQRTEQAEAVRAGAAAAAPPPSPPRMVLVFNCRHDKTPQSLLAPFAGMDFAEVVFCNYDDAGSVSQVPSPTRDLSWQEHLSGVFGALRAEQQRERPQETLCASPREALEHLRERYGRAGVHVLVTGSLYLVGGMLEELQQAEDEDDASEKEAHD